MTAAERSRLRRYRAAALRARCTLVRHHAKIGLTRIEAINATIELDVERYAAIRADLRDVASELRQVVGLLSDRSIENSVQWQRYVRGEKKGFHPAD